MENIKKYSVVYLGFFLFLLVGRVNAAIVNYEITGGLDTATLPVTNDPVADLLNIPRNTVPIKIPVKIKLSVDTDTIPNVRQDNSISQDFEYTNAIINSEIDVNGIKFVSINSPISEKRDVIKIRNNLTFPNADSFVISDRNDPNNYDLYTNYTVPFNQTIGGEFFDNAEVGFERFDFVAFGNDFLDTADLPTNDDGLDNAQGTLTFKPNLQLKLYSRYGNRLSLLNISGEIDDFNVTSVPLPSAAWFFISGLIGLIRIRKKQNIQ